MNRAETIEVLKNLGYDDTQSLEDYIRKCQEAATMGNPIVTDTQYDFLTRTLRVLKPNSEILQGNWEVDDYELDKDDEILKDSRMYSIETIQKIEDIRKFKEAMPEECELFASYKLNGHSVRAVYKYGSLAGGSTRGRTKKGRNITKQLRAVLPNYVDDWKDIRLLEVRGEMLVSRENFELIGKGLKTPLSSVTSLIRDSVTDEELKYLSCVCYKIIPCKDSGYKLNSLESQFRTLAKNGFTVPICNKYYATRDTMDEVFEQILEDFSDDADNGTEFDCDGIVVAVNDTRLFAQMGTNGNYCLGNFAIKMGRHWESNIYRGTIESVEFVYGKKFITPKCRIYPVVTSNGAEVTTVPLYNIGVMNEFKLIPGSDIYFRFGGETGVTLCDASGNMIGDLNR